MITITKQAKTINGKPSYVVVSRGMTIAEICYVNDSWCVVRPSTRIDRFETLTEAKNEALKG